MHSSRGAARRHTESRAESRSIPLWVASDRARPCVFEAQASDVCAPGRSKTVPGAARSHAQHPAHPLFIPSSLRTQFVSRDVALDVPRQELHVTETPLVRL